MNLSKDERLIKRGQACDYTYYINYINKRGSHVPERDKIITINDERIEDMSEIEILPIIMKMIDNERNYVALKVIAEECLPQEAHSFPKLKSKDVEEWREKLKSYVKMYRFGEEFDKLFRIVETLVHSQAIYCDYREKENYFEERLIVRL